MAEWPNTRAGSKVTPASHFVIEVNIRHVVPGTGNTGDRVVDDVTRVVTKGKTALQAVEKAKRLLDVEVQDLTFQGQEDSILGENFPS